jgi:hypothetical protein
MSRDFTPSVKEDSRAPEAKKLQPPPGQSSERQFFPRSHARDAKQQDQQPIPDQSLNLERGSNTSVEIRPNVPLRESRTVLHDRERTYRLRASELYTLINLGRFRVIAAEDLGNHVHRDHRQEMEKDIRNLVRHGMALQRIFEGPNGNRRELMTLTKAGCRLVRANGLLPPSRPLYHGFAKPKEANHDADIYRLYKKEASRIEGEGGKNLRVILDLELKKKLNRDFAQLGMQSRREIADRHGLKVVNGKIPIPDLRIEYETRQGEMARVDLELITENYRPGQVAEKVRSGFSLYARGTEADHLRRVLDQRELTAEILTL